MKFPQNLKKRSVVNIVKYNSREIEVKLKNSKILVKIILNF